MPAYYRIFDTTLSCDFPLPELRESSPTGHSISVKHGYLGSFDTAGFELSFEWRSLDDRVICWCERRDEEYLFVFPGHARFHISAGVITCLRDDESTMQMLRHLLLDQIIPRYLASSGKLVLHASAVTLESGKSVAFIGNSGFGKSTLASSFHENEAVLIGDDSILVDFLEDGVTVIAAYKSIRLFPDSVSAVFEEGSGFAEYTVHSDKQQLILKGDQSGPQSEVRALDALFLLEDPREIDQGETVSIEAMSGSAAMMSMILCAFSLDPGDKQLLKRNFRHIGQAINHQIGIYRLRYPRDHNMLPEVRAAVLECVDRP
jgi:hypothetical protein